MKSLGNNILMMSPINKNVPPDAARKRRGRKREEEPPGRKAWLQTPICLQTLTRSPRAPSADTQEVAVSGITERPMREAGAAEITLWSAAPSPSALEGRGVFLMTLWGLAGAPGSGLRTTF